MAALALKEEAVEPAKPPPAQQENVVLPGLRPDLITTRQLFENRTYYVVKDPVSLQYFRMTAEDYYLATLFDGQRTFGQIREEYARRYPHVRLEYTPEELNERVLRFANDLALLRFLSVQGIRLKAQWDAAKKQKKKKSGLYELANKIFFFRRSVFDPDVVFGRMAKPLWFMWTKTALWISVAFILAAAVVFIMNATALEAAIGNLFSLQNVALMIITTFIIKSVHELGHGLTCKHFGGEVHEVGIMFLVFQPCFFVNISDSWTMPKRLHRIIITAAGIYVELIFAAAATFLWAIVQPGFLKDFLFNFIFIASVSTVVFNANPLMRFDGYYIMMDLLEVPNLQAKSRALITHRLVRLLFGDKGPSGAGNMLSRMPLPKKRLWLFYSYAVLSWLYGYYVIYSLIIFMKPTLEPLGLAGAADWFSALALTSWVLMPLIGFFKGLDIKGTDWGAGGRMRRLVAIACVAFGIFGAACFLPVELKIKRHGYVELADPQQVRPEVTGFVSEVLVSEGDQVKQGQPVAKLTNREVMQDLVAHEARVANAEADIQRALGTDDPSALKQAQIIRNAWDAKLQEAKRDAENLTLRAHIDGTVLSRELDKTVGRAFKSGELFCEIAPLDPMRISVALSEQQMRYIKAGQKVLLKATAYPGKEFRGQIAKDPVTFFAGPIPPAFAQSRGGDVLTYTDSEGNEIPVERTYEAVVEIENPEGLLRTGMSVRGKIYAGTYPWGRLVLQSVLDLINLDYRF